MLSVRIPLILSLFCGIALQPLLASEPLPELLEAFEQRRVEVVEQISKSTIAIFDATANGGGTGVIISEDGFAITNFHVTAPCGALMTVGTNDGIAHQAVIVGIDPCGDIALIKLLGEGPYTPASIGDSDKVRVGDEAIVAGNPFLLAHDFQPTITYGIISGVHRYQPPSGSLLEYTDCLQTDASINPGNSGGPLFDIDGNLIGINGRGSFEKRGRVNVGIGYAVSINQVMRFVPQLKSGRIVDHASLGATVYTSRRGENDRSQAIIDAIETDSDAYRRGLRPGDEILMFGDREIHTANQLLNAIGVCPPGWPVDVLYRRQTDLIGTTVRLKPLHLPTTLREQVSAMEAEQTPPAKEEASDAEPEAWEAFYEKVEDFTNRHFNRTITRELVDQVQSPQVWPHGEQITFALTNRKLEESIIKVSADRVDWQSPRGRFHLNATKAFDQQAVPSEAPGLLAAVWVYQQLANSGTDRLDDCYYLGQLPWKPSFAPADVLHIKHRGIEMNVSFDNDSKQPIGFDITRDVAEDSIRVEIESMTSSDAVWRISSGDKAIGEYQVRWDVEPMEVKP